MMERRCSFLGGQAGEPVREIKAHLIAEDGESADARAVGFGLAVVEAMAY